MRFNRMLLSTTLVVVALVDPGHRPRPPPAPRRRPRPAAAHRRSASPSCTGTSAAPSSASAPGLLADLAPPADHAAGRYALVLCVIGYLAGLVRPDNGRLRSATGPMAVVVAAAIGSTLLYAGVGALVGDTAARHVGLASLLFTAAALRPAARALHRAAASWRSPDAPRTTRSPRASSASQGGRRLLRLALLRHRPAHRQPARRPAREGRRDHGRPRAGRIKGVKRL